MSARLMNYGANVLSLLVPDKKGVTADVVLGFEKLKDYFVNDPYFGCCVVPCGNRIGGAAFTLNGKTYTLDKNDGVNNLHSGFDPLCRRIWEVANVSDTSITFTYHKPDMDMGFPGNMDISVTYTITEDNCFRIDYKGLSDADTIFNPTNHSYFNLSGHDSGDILDHEVWINASKFTMTDEASIPNGTLLDVAGTPMDFTTAKPMRPEVDDSYQQLAWAKGYDHNFALDITEGELSLAASLYDPKSGRKMEVYTDLPGMQLYCGNYIASGAIGKGGVRYEPRYGVCFETQYFPNAINIPAFSQPVAKAGVEAKTSTVYKFV
jgi:aldose 1-epimerase